MKTLIVEEKSDRQTARISMEDEEKKIKDAAKAEVDAKKAK